LKIFGVGGLVLSSKIRITPLFSDRSDFILQKEKVFYILEISFKIDADKFIVNCFGAENDSILSLQELAGRHSASLHNERNPPEMREHSNKGLRFLYLDHDRYQRVATFRSRIPNLASSNNQTHRR